MNTAINNLEIEIKNSINPYKVKSLKEKLSWLKAEQKGNYVSREHLTEYRNLIIWKIKNSLYYNTQQNVVNVMNILLAKVEANEIIFRTEKGIKGLLMDAVIFAAQKVCTDVLVSIEGDEIWTNSNLRCEGSVYYRIQSYYLNLKMGN